MSDLNWNDHFDNDRECGGSYESPAKYKSRVARAKAYKESLKSKQAQVAKQLMRLNQTAP